MLSVKDQSPNNYAQKGNGGEVETQEARDYEPGDFSQPAINEGQRRINYELVEADKKLIEALKKVRDVLATLPGCRESDLAAITKAISEADEISDSVADIIPPGCLGN
jgi:hypothetical protein